MSGTLRRLARNEYLFLLLLLFPSVALAGPTYYVDGLAGSDSYSDVQAQNPATPWRTIRHAVNAGGLVNITNKGAPLAGYTVIVKPGRYEETVESGATRPRLRGTLQFP